MTDNHWDPGLHLFVDDAEVQDHPGFTRLVLQPARVQLDPVVRSDRPWEGNSVALWGSVLYDEEENLFKMWYFTFGTTDNGDQVHFMCYAVSTDGIRWDKPDLGIVPWKGSTATNIVYPPPARADIGMDPWGVVKDTRDPDPSRRYKMGGFQERLADVPRANNTNTGEERQAYMRSVADRHGMYAAFSPDGLNWMIDDTLLIPRCGDAGAMVYDYAGNRFVAISRRYNTVVDHFVLLWKKYRRVIAVSTSDDFATWTPAKTVLKPDDFDQGRDQMYDMVPFAYGNQYLGFVWMFRTELDLGLTELTSGRAIDHWQRVGKREPFLNVGAPGSWDDGWVTCAANGPIRREDKLHIYYSGIRRHGSDRINRGGIGLVTLRKDGFVALRCGNQGGDVMTEPVAVSGPRLFLNAAVFGTKMGAEFGSVRVRVVVDTEVPEEFTFEACNGLVRDDQTDFEITWGPDRKNLSHFAGRKVRLHIQADSPTSLYSYRFGS